MTSKVPSAPNAGGRWQSPVVRESALRWGWEIRNASQHTLRPEPAAMRDSHGPRRSTSGPSADQRRCEVRQGIARAACLKAGARSCNCGASSTAPSAAGRTAGRFPSSRRGGPLQGRPVLQRGVAFAKGYARPDLCGRFEGPPCDGVGKISRGAEPGQVGRPLSDAGAGEPFGAPRGA